MERGQIVTRMTLVFTSSDGDPSRHPARPGISCHSTDWTPAEGEVLVKKLKQMAVELAKLHKFNNPKEYELDGLPTGYRLFTKKRTNSSNMGPKLDYAFFGGPNGSDFRKDSLKSVAGHFSTFPYEIKRKRERLTLPQKQPMPAPSLIHFHPTPPSAVQIPDPVQSDLFKESAHSQLVQSKNYSPGADLLSNRFSSQFRTTEIVWVKLKTPIPMTWLPDEDMIQLWPGMVTSDESVDLLNGVGLEWDIFSPILPYDAHRPLQFLEGGLHWSPDSDTTDITAQYRIAIDMAAYFAAHWSVFHLVKPQPILLWGPEAIKPGDLVRLSLQLSDLLLPLQSPTTDPEGPLYMEIESFNLSPQQDPSSLDNWQAAGTVKKLVPADTLSVSSLFQQFRAPTLEQEWCDVVVIATPVRNIVGRYYSVCPREGALIAATRCLSPRFPAECDDRLILMERMKSLAEMALIQHSQAITDTHSHSRCGNSQT